MINKVKLRLEEGVLANVIVFLVLYVALFVIAFFLTIPLKRTTIKHLNAKLGTQGFSQENLLEITNAIQSIPAPDFMGFFIIFLAWYLAGYFIITCFDSVFLLFCKKKRITPYCISDAFDTLQLFSLSDKLKWLKESKLKIYITAKDLKGHQEEVIEATVYPFISLPLRKFSYFKIRLSENRISLNKEEFDNYLTNTSSNDNSLKERMNYNKLIKENKELEKKLHLASAREKKSFMSDTIAFYIGRLGVPLIDRLKDNGHNDMYTDAMIKDELIKTLESHGEVFESILKGNTNPLKKEPKDFITSAHISIVKNALGEFAKKPGKPSVNKTF